MTSNTFQEIMSPIRELNPLGFLDTTRCDRNTFELVLLQIYGDSIAIRNSKCA
ncbi:uncharacterized protein G2W53_004330 [Senna tora]|uniref:Uncharacterized protein n=1 Tax=Senna tora TaxID=362788 RepID=A0A834XCV9_9FABA|nr:uncharacterized protein G2W53_004330 [Senna tora]